VDSLSIGEMYVTFVYNESKTANDNFLGRASVIFILAQRSNHAREGRDKVLEIKKT
jgi:hypothetical protein